MESSLALTDALMRMRSRLRDENEKIILELQNDAARKIDLYIKDKLQIYQEDLKGKKESFIREIFQILEEKVSAFIHSSEIYSSLQQIIPKVSKTTASMDGNKIAEVPTHFFPVTPFSSHTSPSFPIPSTHSSLASPDTKNEQKNDAPDMAETHEIYDEDLNRIAQEFLQTYQSFIQSHQMNILKEIEDTTIGSGSDTNLYTDIELKGQLQWSNNMENAKNEWSEMGSKRLAIEESYKEILENEENTMIQYVNDQLNLAYDAMILHLEKDIQDMISSLLISMERDHMTLLAQAQSELQRINELADMIDRTGDIESIRFSSHIICSAQQAVELHKSVLQQSYELYRKNIYMACQVGVLRQIEDQKYSSTPLIKHLIKLYQTIEQMERT